MFQFKQKQIFHLSDILFYSRLKWIRWCHEHWWGQFTLLSPLIQMLIYCKNILRDISRNNDYQLSGYPLAQSSWYTKLTITAYEHYIFWHFFFFKWTWNMGGEIEKKHKVRVRPMALEFSIGESPNILLKLVYQEVKIKQ